MGAATVRTFRDATAAQRAAHARARQRLDGAGRCDMTPESHALRCQCGTCDFPALLMIEALREA
jgi:hypothetical protein